MKKTFIIVCSVIFVLTLIIGFWLKNFYNKIYVANAFQPSQVNLSDSIEQHFKDKTAFNILLLGYGGGNHDGTYLTDSMIVAHIDPDNQIVILISIPRDIWVKIPTNPTSGSYWKINAAYQIGIDDQDYPKKDPQYTGATGGGNLSKYMVGLVTGLPINRFIAVDFKGFSSTIDALGGVDVNVEKTFDDYEYPIEGKEANLCGHPQSDLTTLDIEATQDAVETIFPCRYEHLHFNAGMQHMDGATALKFVRSRHSLQDGTDFGRSIRQRNLLLAVKQKVVSLNFLSKALPVINSLKDDFKTDFSLDDMKSLLLHEDVLSKYQIKSLALTNDNFLKDDTSADGQAILVPRDGLDNWSEVHDWVLSMINPNLQLSSPLIEVENGTLVAGLAELATDRLQDQDYDVLPPTDADNRNLTKTTIEVFNSKIDSHIIDDLKKEFKTDDVIISDNQTQQEYAILITVGQDYSQSQGKKLIN